MMWFENSPRNLLQKGQPFRLININSAMMTPNAQIPQMQCVTDDSVMTLSRKDNDFQKE